MNAAYIAAVKGKIMTKNIPEWAKDIPVIDSDEIKEIQNKIANGELSEAVGNEKLKQAAFSVISARLEESLVSCEE